jgi:dienelactone hydrolase
MATQRPAIERSLPIIVDTAPDLPGYNIYRPTDLGAVGRHPVVAWANGGGVRHDATWRPLLERWAAAGFIVVAITQLPGREVSLEDRTTAADQAKAIDWALAQDTRSGGPYQGRFDVNQIAAAGNSYGGVTSLALAGTDPRVRGVFVLSGSSVGPTATRDQAAAVIDKVTQPVSFVVGGDEDVASAQAGRDYDLLAEGIPAYLARRATGDHVTVSTDPDILVDAAEIGINWFDLVLAGNETARRNLTENACASFKSGTWSAEAKNLDSLVQAVP